MKTPKGFTLIELMVTVSVMAILLGVGAPAMQTMLANSRSATQTNEFISALKLARSEAIKLNRSITLCRTANAAATVCAAAHADGWANWAILDGTTALRRGASASPIQVQIDGGTAIASLVVRPSGIINIGNTENTAPVQIRSTSPGASRYSEREVGPTGRIHDINA